MTKFRISPENYKDMEDFADDLVNNDRLLLVSEEFPKGQLQQIQDLGIRVQTSQYLAKEIVMSIDDKQFDFRTLPPIRTINENQRSEETSDTGKVRLFRRGEGKGSAQKES